jgi:hypothetical protein
MSTSQLSQAVQAAISQNLTGVVAGELSDFIEKAKQTEARLERSREENASLSRQIADLQGQINAHRALAERENAVATRESAAQAKEIELIKREASIDAKIAQAELGGVKYSMEAFLKNATVRETVVSDVAKPVDGFPGGNGMSGGPGYLVRDHRPDTTTVTRTTE